MLLTPLLAGIALIHNNLSLMVIRRSIDSLTETETQILVGGIAYGEDNRTS